MAVLDPFDVIRNTFLAGVGAVATGAEKTSAFVEDLVKKGEITVEQGKSLNEELTRKVKNLSNDTQDSLLRSKLEGMSSEERAAYAQKVADMAKDLDAKATKVDVTVEDATDDDDAK